MFFIKYRLVDFISLEAWLLLFMLSGGYKDASAIVALNEYVDITLGTCAMVYIMTVWRIFRQGLPKNGLFYGYMALYVLFVVYAGINFQISKHDIYGVLKMQKLLVFNSCALICPLLAIQSKDHIERWWRLMVLFATVAALYSIIAGITSGHVRLATAFGGASSHALANILGFSLVGILAVGVYTRNQLERFAIIAIAGLFALVILLSGARQAVVASMAGYAYTIFFLWKSGYDIKRIVWSFVIVVLAIMIFTVIKSRISETTDIRHSESRMSTLVTMNRMELLEKSHRLSAWTAGLDIWQQSPAIGVGFGAYELYRPGSYYPHNYFIELLAELGIIGFVLGCGLLMVPIWVAIKKLPNNKSWWACAMGSLFFYGCVCIMVSGDISVNRMFFAIWSMTIVSAFMKPQNHSMRPILYR